MLTEEKGTQNKGEYIRQMIENALRKEGFLGLEEETPGENQVLLLKVSAAILDADQIEEVKQNFETADDLLEPIYLKGTLNSRGRSMPQDIDIIDLGSMKIDYQERQLFLDGKEVSLTRKEMELLTYLAYHCNSVVKREELLENIWGYRYDGDIRTVDTHIKRLRKKLGRYGKNIVTVRSVGYRFIWNE